MSRRGNSLAVERKIALARLAVASLCCTNPLERNSFDAGKLYDRRGELAVVVYPLGVAFRPIQSQLAVFCSLVQTQESHKRSDISLHDLFSPC